MSPYLLLFIVLNKKYFFNHDYFFFLDYSLTDKKILDLKPEDCDSPRIKKNINLFFLFLLATENFASNSFRFSH